MVFQQFLQHSECRKQSIWEMRSCCCATTDMEVFCHISQPGRNKPSSIFLAEFQPIFLRHLKVSESAG